MADIIDDAAEKVEQFNRAALQRVLSQPTARSTGVCKNCQCIIEADRLRALPHTPHCSECASALEEDAARRAKRGPL